MALGFTVTQADLRLVGGATSQVCRAVGRNGGTGASLGIDGLFHLPEDPNDPPEDPTREVITAWHVDGLEWAKETHPPLTDMWADWNLGKAVVNLPSLPHYFSIFLVPGCA